MKLLVASDGLDAKAGSLSANWDRFIAWKSVDGIKEAKNNFPDRNTNKGYVASCCSFGFDSAFYL